MPSIVAGDATPLESRAVRSKPRIVLGPMNHADMAMAITRVLKQRGYVAEHIQYTTGRGHPFRYELDTEIDVLAGGGWIEAQSANVRRCLEAGFDIFHFWNRSFFFNYDYAKLSGLDIPILKAHGRKIVYRFTGFDLRLPSLDIKVNPHSPSRYGYVHPYDEAHQRAYLGLVQDYAERLVVQDPEMGQFCATAKVIPRGLDLKQWSFVGITPTDRPLIVHAPSIGVVKGTRFVLKAVEELRDEGLSFEFKLIQGLPHAAAQEWYHKADVIVDQLLIGATGVLTLEGWALGKPVVVNLRDELFKPFYQTNELPVANANPDTIKDVLRRLIKDYEWRHHLSLAGRSNVEKFHDIETIVNQHIELYDEVHRSPVRVPAGTRDIDFVRFHAGKEQRFDALVERIGGTEKLGKFLQLDRPAEFSDLLLEANPPKLVSNILKWAYLAKRLFSRMSRRIKKITNSGT